MSLMEMFRFAKWLKSASNAIATMFCQPVVMLCYDNMCATTRTRPYGNIEMNASVRL